MMKLWMICSVLVLLLVFGVFAHWLGWGRAASWETATGWGGLPDEERQFCEASTRAFAAIATAPKLTWLGHATVLIEWQGQRCVVDPVVAERVQVAPRWFNAPMLDLSQTYDLILLTHAHMDHLDLSTLETLPATRIVLPAGTERFLSQAVRQKHRIELMAMGGRVALGGLEVISVSAVHGGWRYPWQRGLFACGYVFRAAGEALYVAGDTAKGDHFEQIAEAYHPRYAVLPIGAYAPQWFLQSRHLNPEEALDAAEQLGVGFVMPYHFGTYRLSLEPMAEPLQRFSAEALKRDQLWILTPALGKALGGQLIAPLAR